MKEKEIIKLINSEIDRRFGGSYSKEDEYSISNSVSGSLIGLYKNGKWITSIADEGEENEFRNMSYISRKIAEGMGNLLNTEETLDRWTDGYYVYFNNSTLKWDIESSGDMSMLKHFKSLKFARIAHKLLSDFHEHNKMFGFTLKELREKE